MTLIVPFISDDFVALASDRRITWTRNRRVVKWEDTENKAIVLCGHWLMGYTGIARLGGGTVSTDRWVVEELLAVGPASYFGVLEERTEAALRTLRLEREDSGHAFVAVGYEPGPSGSLEPAAVAVSNALGDGAYGTWAPAPRVSVLRPAPLLQSEGFALSAYGRAPARPVIEETIDLVRRYRKRHRTRALGVLQLMVALVRRVSSYDDGVSAHVSVSVLPRVAVPAEAVHVPLSGQADPLRQLTCVFVPDDNELEQGIAYPPSTVCPAFATRGAEIWSEKPPWWTD